MVVLYPIPHGRDGSCIASSLLTDIWVISFSLFFGLSRSAPAACGGSQGRGQIRAVAAGLHHSHSNARFEPCLRPTPQFMAMLDP